MRTVQEMFAHVLRRPRTLKGDNDLGYLMRALQNTFLSSRRAISRRPRTCRDQLEFIEDRRALRPEASLEVADVYTRLYRARQRVVRAVLGEAEASKR
jgi:RNA polymerase sigma-70 factor (ECF subfamily)